MPTRICIVGCGALGSVFAAHLARVPDVEVYAFDVSEKHVVTIREKGLRVTGAVDFSVKVAVTTEAREIPRCDFGIVATKSAHTHDAIRQTAHIFNESSAVCSIQNGLGNEEVIAEYVGRVIRGATTMAAHLVAPGHARLEFYSELWMGPFEPSGTPYDCVERLAKILNRSGLRVVPMHDARGAQWTKLIFNSAVNPIGALTRLHHRAATRLPETSDLYEALLREGEAVARKLGITLHGDARAMIVEGARSAGKRNVSMLLDVLSKRETEVDFVNGAIAEVGEKLGVPVPLNRALWALVKGLEHSWGDPA